MKLPFNQAAPASALLCVISVASPVTKAADAPAPRLAQTIDSRDFLNPPDSAKPIVIWQWMNGCVTKEGITSDLESFKRVGVGGVQQFLIGGSEAEITDSSVEVLNPKWNDLMRFTIEECARLGLSFGTHNCPGWSSSGAPGVQVGDSMQKLVWSSAAVTGFFAGKLERPMVDAKWGFYRDVAVLAVPAEGDISLDQVIDLTGQMAPDGALSWNAPAGPWTILRIGHTTTGQINGTGPVSGQGLEVDKMSRDALERFWKTYPEKVLALAGPHAGKTFVRWEIDSYEAGDQNWTPKMRAEFLRRRGYDLLPWLPALLGRTVASRSQTTRFREDWNRTIDDLFAENYYGSMTELTHRVPGMRLIIEPYGTGHAPFTDCLSLGRKGDILMSEFWWGTTWGWSSIKAVASSAHTNDRTISAAEAFTGQPTSAWRVDPYSLRAPGDRAFAAGVNQFFLHAAAHQPWPTWKPGMTMGFWGTQFGPGQTWWEHGGPDWLRYVARSQHLLQQGVSVGDICWLQAGPKPPALPRGYDGDLIARDTLIENLRVKDGLLTLPGGQTYRLLVLPNTDVMPLVLAQKIRELVREGAIVHGPKPTRAPGLQNFPASDQEVAQIADELWADCDGTTRREHTYGKGRVLWGMPLEEALAQAKIAPDLLIDDAAPLVWIHRKIGDTELYFISNQTDQPLAVTPSFRVTGRIPELWHADTGVIEHASLWRSENGRTTVSLSFGPSDSVFVVFRTPSGETDPVVSLGRGDQELLNLASTSPRPAASAPAELRTDVTGLTSLLAREAGLYRIQTASGRTRTVHAAALPPAVSLAGPWEVSFPPGWGAPGHVIFDKLASWTESPDQGVKYFSGTATYTKSLHLAAELFAPGQILELDLGQVKNVAEVTLNGRDVGTLWSPPFRADVTRFLQPGANTLEIRVTNLWPNRLIGDEQLPNDLDWGADAIFDRKLRVGKHLSAVPDWIAAPTQRASGRFTFTTFKFFDAVAPLLDAGLLGPVRIEAVRQIAISP